MLFRFWVFPDCTFLDISNVIYKNEARIVQDDIIILRKKLIK